MARVDQRVREKRPFFRPKIWSVLSAVILLALAGILFSHGLSSGNSGQEHRLRYKYIIHVVVDSLAYDYVGCGGYPLEISPCIDEVAKEGALFQNAVCQKMFTTPSMNSVLTSTYPLTNGIRSNNMTDQVPFRSLPEFLQENGYRIFHTGSTPMSRAFDGEGMSAIPSGACNDDDILKNALEFIRSNRKDPFYLMVFFDSAHTPQIEDMGSAKFQGYLKYFKEKYASGMFDSKRWFLRGYGRDFYRNILPLYTAAVRMTDDRIKKIVETMKGLGMWENTVFILHADHGAFRKYLDDTSIKVPLLIKAPGLEPKVVKEQVELIDLAPTLLDILKIKGRMHPRVEGESLLPLISGKAGHRRKKYAFTEGAGGILCMRADQWKYIYHPDFDNKFREWETGMLKAFAFKDIREDFYDLKNDPYEFISVQGDLIPGRKKKVAEVNRWYKEKMGHGYDFFSQMPADVAKTLFEQGYQ